MLRLGVLKDIEAADSNRFAAKEMRNLDIDMPVEPRPESGAVANRGFGKLVGDLLISLTAVDRCS